MAAPLPSSTTPIQTAALPLSNGKNKQHTTNDIAIEMSKVEVIKRLYEVTYSNHRLPLDKFLEDLQGGHYGCYFDDKKIQVSKQEKHLIPIEAIRAAIKWLEPLRWREIKNNFQV